MGVLNWDDNPDNNITIGAIDIAEGCSPGGLNNAIREMMADTRDFFEDGTCTISLTDSLGNVATMDTGNVFRFWRTGNLVTVMGTLSWSSTTALSGGSRIKLTGLPYSTRNLASLRTPAVFGPSSVGSILIEREELAFYADPNTSFLWGTKMASANTAGNLVKSDLGVSGTIFGLQVTYLSDYF